MSGRCNLFQCSLQLIQCPVTRLLVGPSTSQSPKYLEIALPRLAAWVRFSLIQSIILGKLTSISRVRCANFRTLLKLAGKIYLSEALSLSGVLSLSGALIVSCDIRVTERGTRPNILPMAGKAALHL